MNPFSIFSLPEIFLLDEKDLEQRYFALQRQFHPDRLFKKTMAEKLAAAQHSADVNQAYAVLKHSLKRAQALLSLQGIEVNGEKDTVKPDHALLMEVMELREALEEGQADAKALVHARRETAYAEMVRYLEAEDWTNAAQAAIRFHYFTKMHAS